MESQGTAQVGDPPEDTAVAAAVARIAALDESHAAETESESEIFGADGADFGHYDGLPPHIALSDDGRTATLLAPLAYTHSDGTHWPVPVGATLDGASIPRALWSLIGGPFEGRYRNASIVHDRYCVEQTRAWQDTHRMFHAAMRCSGVGGAQAKVMFYAVYRFGPRWTDTETESTLPAAAAITARDAPSLADDAEAIYRDDPDLDAIEAMADAHSGGVRQ